MFKLGDENEGLLDGTKDIRDEFSQIDTSTASLKKSLESIAHIFTTNLAPSADQFKGVLLLIDKSASGIAKSFGQGRENIQQLKIAMSDAYAEVARMGGKYSDIAGIQGKVAADLGRNVILQSDTIEKLFATQQVTGQNAEVVTKSFKDAGMSALHATEKMGDVVNIARSQGVNAQAVSKLVVDNMKNLNMYTFQGGVDGLAKMAAQATSMRFSMSETIKFAEKVFNPEGAIETAAALQRLGVTQSQLLDPLRLMDLAQNDPTELQNQLVQMTEQFVQLNKHGQFEVLPDAKRQLREISREMGISYDELVKMSIGSAELNDKMSKIRFPDVFTEEQKTFVANMAEMGSGGEYKLRIDGEEIGLDKAMDIFAKDNSKLLKFMEDSKPKSMEELAINQLDTLTKIESDVASMAHRTTVAASSSKIGEDILGSFRKMSGIPAKEMERREILTTKGLREDVFDMASELISEKFAGGFSMEAVGELVTALGPILLNYGESQKKKFTEDSSLGGDKTLEANDFILKTHPKDSIVFSPNMMVGGTNLFGGQQNTMSESKNTHDININVQLSAQPGVDVNQMTKKEILEPLVAHIQKVITGDGLLNKNGKLPNPIVNYQV